MDNDKILLETKGLSTKEKAMERIQVWENKYNKKRIYWKGLPQKRSPPLRLLASKSDNSFANFGIHKNKFILEPEPLSDSETLTKFLIYNLEAT